MTLGPLSAVASWITKTIFLLRDRKRRVNTAAQFIANELAFNAEIVKGWERQYLAMADVREQLVLTAWEQHRAEAFALKRNHDALWNEVVEDYNKLQLTISRGATPPQGVHLGVLAEQLRELSF